MRNYFSIYVAEFLNGKQYVGKTKDLKNRLSVHCWAAKHKKTRSYFHAAIRKHGMPVAQEIFVAFTEEDAFVVERQLIVALNTKAPFGYNLTDGGEGISGFHHSSETKQKIKTRNAALYASFKGKPMLAQTKRALKQANTGRKVSEETRRKISLAATGQPYKGGGKKQIPVMCVETGVCYPSMKAAALSIDRKDSQNIVNCVAGRVKTAGGYSWKKISRV